MGTNYYWHEKEACPACGHSSEGLHIGKSSAGWVFALRVYPDQNINRLDDWIARFWMDGSQIRDEYGTAVPPTEMVGRIAGRGGPAGRPLLRGSGPDADRTVARGPGTWDLHNYEFS
jgi:hypothetical protein